MSENVYSVSEIVGTSTVSVDDAIKGAISRATETIRQIGWFEVSEIRGHVENGEIAHYQVTLKVGFALEDTKP